MTMVHKLKESKTLNVRSAEEQETIKNLELSDGNPAAAADEGGCGC